MTRRSAWIFGGVMIFLLFTFSFLFAETKEADKVNPEGKTEEAAFPEVDAAVQSSQEEVEDPFAAKFNPETSIFEAPKEANAPAIQVVLQGIGMGAKGSYAVINGDVFYAGEEKKGIKMVEVKRREVDIIVGGAPRTVPLFPGEDLKLAQEQQRKKTEKGVSSQEQKGKGSEFSPGEERPASYEKT